MVQTKGLTNSNTFRRTFLNLTTRWGLSGIAVRLRANVVIATPSVGANLVFARNRNNPDNRNDNRSFRVALAHDFFSTRNDRRFKNFLDEVLKDGAGYSRPRTVIYSVPGK